MYAARFSVEFSCCLSSHKKAEKASKPTGLLSHYTAISVMLSFSKSVFFPWSETREKIKESAAREAYSQLWCVTGPSTRTTTKRVKAMAQFSCNRSNKTKAELTIWSGLHWPPLHSHHERFVPWCTIRYGTVETTTSEIQWSAMRINQDMGRRDIIQFRIFCLDQPGEVINDWITFAEDSCCSSWFFIADI